MSDIEGAPEGSVRDRSGGFLMMDLLVALVVMALIAGLALPFVRTGGHGALRAKAEEIAATLRSARAAALLSGRRSDVAMDADRRVLRSRTPANVIFLPRGLTMKAFPASSTNFVFTADGRSSGGMLLLAAGPQRLIVRVDPFSASVDVVAP